MNDKIIYHYCTLETFIQIVGLWEEQERDDVLDICNQNISLGHNNELSIQPISYQARGNKLVCYADLDFSNLVCEGIIRAIIVGPKSKASIGDVVNFLYINGFDETVAVKLSSATYQ